MLDKVSEFDLEQESFDNYAERMVQFVDTNSMAGRKAQTHVWHEHAQSIVACTIVASIVIAFLIFFYNCNWIFYKKQL